MGFQPTDRMGYQLVETRKRWPPCRVFGGEAKTERRPQLAEQIPSVLSPWGQKHPRKSRAKTKPDPQSRITP